jgi:uncharacterized protein YajQ (UPF0234 family)
MAQQFSFDVVSDVDQQELDNAINQAKKEVEQRYDFKGSNTTIEYDQKEKKLTLHTSDDMKLRALSEIINAKMIKRNISLKALEYGKAEPAAGSTLRQTVKIKSGLESEQARSRRRSRATWFALLARARMNFRKRFSCFAPSISIFRSSSPIIVDHRRT